MSVLTSKRNFTIVIVAENGFMTEDYVKEVKCIGTTRFRAIDKAEKIVSKLMHTYNHAYIADVHEWSTYVDPPIEM